MILDAKAFSDRIKKATVIGLFSLLLFLCFACEEILLEKDISVEYVALGAPVNGSVIKSNQVLFSWDELEFADGYRIQVARPGFDNASQILVNTKLEENSYETSLPPGNYQWRVQAFNSGYQTLYTSAFFTVEKPENFTDYTVQLLTPIDKSLFSTNTIQLTWGELEEAQLYRVELIQDGQVYNQKSTEETQITLDFASGKTNWKVRAENEGQNTSYSTRELTVDTLSPNVPKLLSPKDNSSVDSPIVDFKWKRDPIEGTEEYDSLYIYNDVALKELRIKDRVTQSAQYTLVRDSTFYWNMKAFDEAGNSGEISETFQFTVD